jgi:hypothetical protein
VKISEAVLAEGLRLANRSSLRVAELAAKRRAAQLSSSSGFGQERQSLSQVDPKTNPFDVNLLDYKGSY